MKRRGMRANASVDFFCHTRITSLFVRRRLSMRWAWIQTIPIGKQSDGTVLGHWTKRPLSVYARRGGELWVVVSVRLLKDSYRSSFRAASCDFVDRVFVHSRAIH